MSGAGVFAVALALLLAACGPEPCQSSARIISTIGGEVSGRTCHPDATLAVSPAQGDSEAVSFLVKCTCPQVVKAPSPTAGQ